MFDREPLLDDQPDIVLSNGFELVTSGKCMVDGR